MDIPVLIESLGPDKFRATVFNLSVEGTTMDDARQRVQDKLDELLKADGRVMAIRVPVPDWAAEFSAPSAAGILKDNPLFDEWLEAMAENRRRADANPDY
jgi:hypothetical protein